MATTPLPRSVQPIADVIGRAQALKLVGALPRCRAGIAGKESNRVICYIPLPRTLHAEHRLVQILGWTDALRLCQAYGGEILQPANCAEILRAHRVRSIAVLHECGYAIDQIAKLLNCCKRTVNNALRAIPQEADSRT